jgi:hypothetical protein
MSRSARRKTLSHSEIENFLNDISFSNKTDVAKCRPDTSSTSGAKENCHEPWFDDTVEDTCLSNDRPRLSEAVGEAKKKVSSIEVCSEIQSIRDFCKVLRDLHCHAVDDTNHNHTILIRSSTANIPETEAIRSNRSITSAMQYCQDYTGKDDISHPHEAIATARAILIPHQLVGSEEELAHQPIAHAVGCGSREDKGDCSL